MGAAVAEAHHNEPKEMTVLATAVPQAPLEQSLSPYSKLTFLQRQAGSGEEQPSWEYCASMFWKQTCPHEGRAAMAVTVAAEDVEAGVGKVVRAAVADAQYDDPKAMTVLATAVPQAPF